MSENKNLEQGLKMNHLIDCFKPKELLHIVGISNKLRILNTEEKKYLIAVRMGTSYENNSYSLDLEKKNNFHKTFFKFMNQFPMNYHCETEDCPICNRLKDLKFDFEHNHKTKEYSLLMTWFNQGISHYQEQGITQEDKIPQEIAEASAKFQDSVNPAQSIAEEGLSTTTEDSYKRQEDGLENPITVQPMDIPQKNAHPSTSQHFKQKQESNNSHNFPKCFQDTSKVNLDLLDESNLRIYGLELQNQVHKLIEAWQILLQEEKDPIKKLAISTLFKEYRDIISSKKDNNKEIPA